MRREIEELGVRAVSRILWTALRRWIGEGLNAAGHGLCDWYANRWDCDRPVPDGDRDGDDDAGSRPSRPPVVEIDFLNFGRNPSLIKIDGKTVEKVTRVNVDMAVGEVPVVSIETLAIDGYARLDDADVTITPTVAQVEHRRKPNA